MRATEAKHGGLPLLLVAVFNILTTMRTLWTNRKNPEMMKQAMNSMKGMDPDVMAKMMSSAQPGITPEMAKMSAQMMSNMSEVRISFSLVLSICICMYLYVSVCLSLKHFSLSLSLPLQLSMSHSLSLCPRLIGFIPPPSLLPNQLSAFSSPSTRRMTWLA
jgi:hypothetical protein